MIELSLYALGSSLAVSVLSFFGILLFLTGERFTKRVLLYVVSFSTGSLLGDVLLHMFPEMIEMHGEAMEQSFVIVLAGILFSFLLEKIVRWRHCHVLPTPNHEHCHHAGVMNLVGDGVHNFIDGLVIGASFLVSIPIGITTTVAVALHEIPHEIGDYAVLIHSGFRKSQALWLNFASACSAILGTAVVLVAASSVVSLELVLLPFAAGNLLYIAAADLIPELHRETGIRSGLLQLLCMAAGIGVMYALLGLE